MALAGRADTAGWCPAEQAPWTIDQINVKRR